MSNHLIDLIFFIIAIFIWSGSGLAAVKWYDKKWNVGPLSRALLYFFACVLGPFIWEEAVRFDEELRGKK